MDRRQFLELAAYSTVAGVASTAGATPSSREVDEQPPGVAWRRAFEDGSFDAAVPAHGDGFVLAGRGESGRSADSPVTVRHLDGTGAVRRRRSLTPEVGEDARQAGADMERTDSGYVVASGPWFARLDAEFAVETTGSASGFVANRRTRVVETDEGVAVATDLKSPNHATTRVHGFGSDGDHRWTRRVNPDRALSLGFLFGGDGVVVGGTELGSGRPWLAGVAPDGTTRWQGVVTDAPTGFSAVDAISDGSGFTVLGRSGLLRLTGERSVAWQRSGDRRSGTVLARATDGGYVLAGRVGKRHVRVARTSRDGSLRWSHEYRVPDEATAWPDPSAIVEREPGEYLVVGSRSDDSTGWVLSLSTAVEPPTTTATRTRNEQTTSRTPGTPTSRTTTGRSGALDGSAGALGLGLAGLAGLGATWLIRRR